MNLFGPVNGSNLNTDPLSTHSRESASPSSKVVRSRSSKSMTQGPFEKQLSAAVSEKKEVPSKKVPSDSNSGDPNLDSASETQGSSKKRRGQNSNYIGEGIDPQMVFTPEFRNGIQDRLDPLESNWDVPLFEQLTVIPNVSQTRISTVLPANLPNQALDPSPLILEGKMVEMLTSHDLRNPLNSLAKESGELGESLGWNGLVPASQPHGMVFPDEKWVGKKNPEWSPLFLTSEKALVFPKSSESFQPSLDPFSLSSESLSFNPKSPGKLDAEFSLEGLQPASLSSLEWVNGGENQTPIDVGIHPTASRDELGTSANVLSALKPQAKGDRSLGKDLLMDDLGSDLKRDLIATLPSQGPISFEWNAPPRSQSPVLQKWENLGVLESISPPSAMPRPTPVVPLEAEKTLKSLTEMVSILPEGDVATVSSPAEAQSLGGWSVNFADPHAPSHSSESDSQNSDPSQKALADGAKKDELSVPSETESDPTAQSVTFSSSLVQTEAPSGTSGVKVHSVRHDLEQRIEKLAENLSKTQMGSAKISFKESSVGQVDIRINLSSDRKLYVQMNIENEILKEQLESQAHKLKSLLQDQNKLLADVHINVHSISEVSDAQKSSQDSRSNHHSHSNPFSSESQSGSQMSSNMGSSQGGASGQNSNPFSDASGFHQRGHPRNLGRMSSEGRVLSSEPTVRRQTLNPQTSIQVIA